MDATPSAMTNAAPAGEGAPPEAEAPPPAWSVALPLLAVAGWAASTALGLAAVPADLPGAAAALVLAALLLGAIFAAVHHAEAVAHRVGEPLGTLVLTIAVTVIEVALIAYLMLAEGPVSSLPRDTVFAVIMIILNGIVGLCVLLGGLRHGQQGFRTAGASAYLVVLAAMATLTMVLPNTTRTAPGPYYAPSQLLFVSVVTLALYAAFLYVQTVRHRDHFVAGVAADRDEGHAEGPLWLSLGLLIVALFGVVMLAKGFAALVEFGVARAGAPAAVSGIVIALLILLPEGVAAARAARADQLQRAVNLALGSSIATIGLTIPAVAAVAWFLDKRLVLGLTDRDVTLLALTLFVSLLTFGSGRSNVLHGFVHAVLFATFVFLSVVP